MSIKEISKVIETLPESGIEKLSLIAQGMMMAQQSDLQSADSDTIQPA